MLTSGETRHVFWGIPGHQIIEIYQFLKNENSFLRGYINILFSQNAVDKSPEDLDRIRNDKYIDINILYVFIYYRENNFIKIDFY